jgi:hypothetical protein
LADRLVDVGHDGPPGGFSDPADDAASRGRDLREELGRRLKSGNGHDPGLVSCHANSAARRLPPGTILLISLPQHAAAAKMASRALQRPLTDRMPHAPALTGPFLYRHCRPTDEPHIANGLAKRSAPL